jgi:hypothetical protein
LAGLMINTAAAVACMTQTARTSCPDNCPAYLHACTVACLLRKLQLSSGPVGILICLQMSDEPSKLGTHYSIGQREYFKHVVRTPALLVHREQCCSTIPCFSFIQRTTRVRLFIYQPGCAACSPQ